MKHKQEITEKEEKYIKKIIDESIKLTLMEKIIELNKDDKHNQDFGREVRGLLSILNNKK